MIFGTAAQDKAAGSASRRRREMRGEKILRLKVRVVDSCTERCARCRCYYCQRSSKAHALQLCSDMKRLQPPRVGRQPEPPHRASRKKVLTRSARARSCSAFLPSTECRTICLTTKLTLESENSLIPCMPVRTPDGSVTRFSRKGRRRHQRTRGGRGLLIFLPDACDEAVKCARN